MIETNSAPTDDFAAMRRAMVASQLRTNGVTQLALLEAMGRISREAFVHGEARAAAYIDRALPLGNGRALNPPMTTARLIESAAIGPKTKVLIVGAATGYALAIATALSQSVVGVESDVALADSACANVPDATVVVGAMSAGAAEHGPYDAIVVDGAIEFVPDALIAQLAPAGRLAAAIRDKGVTRLSLGRRGGTSFATIDFADAEAVVLPGFAKEKAFVF